MCRPSDDHLMPVSSNARGTMIGSWHSWKAHSRKISVLPFTRSLAIEHPRLAQCEGDVLPHGPDDRPARRDSRLGNRHHVLCRLDYLGIGLLVEITDLGVLGHPLAKVRHGSPEFCNFIIGCGHASMLSPESWLNECPHPSIRQGHVGYFCSAGPCTGQSRVPLALVEHLDSPSPPFPAQQPMSTATTTHTTR